MLEVQVLIGRRLFGDKSILFSELYSIFCRLDLTWRSASQGWIGQGLILLISSLVKGGRWTRRNCGECLQLLDRTDSAKTSGTLLILYTQHEHQHHGISFQLLNRAEFLKANISNAFSTVRTCAIACTLNWSECRDSLVLPKICNGRKCSLLLLIFPLHGSIKFPKRENYEKTIHWDWFKRENVKNIWTSQPL